MAQAFPILRPLDLAFEDLRAHGLRLLPPYLAGMIPFTLASAWLAEAWIWRRGDLLPAACAALAACAPPRRLGRAAAQRRLLTALGRSPPPLARRWLPLLAAEMRYACLGWWGMLLPPVGLYGMVVHALAAPALLASDEPAAGLVRALARRARKHYAPLALAGCLVLGGWLLLAVNLFALLAFVTELLLPSLLGVDAPEFTRVAWSATGALGVLYAAFVAVDFVGCALAVRLDIQLRDARDGGDLLQRLVALEQAAPPVSGGDRP